MKNQLFLLTLFIIGCRGVTESPYHVIFDLDGGGWGQSLRVLVNQGERVEKPLSNPQKEGSIFDSWYKGDQVYDFNSPVLDDLELKAHWQIQTYTVSFDLDGGDGPALDDLYPNHGDTINKPIPDPSKSGENFVGWYLGGNPYDFSSPVISDISLVAQWNSKVYTVSFDLDGGDGPALDDLYPNHGDTINKPIPDPSKSGEDFVDWYLGGNPYDFSSPVISDISLVAQWNSKVYTVSFDLDGGDGPALDDLYPNHGDTINKPIPDPSKSGEDFVDWYLGGNPYDFSSPVISDISLVAQWNSKVYTVSFDLDGGDGPALDDLYPNHGDTINKPIPDPSKSGEDFVDWYLGGNPYDFSSPVISDISLVAQWNSKVYTVSFDLAGGDGPALDDLYPNHGDTINKPIPDPSKSGEDFVDWYLGGNPYDFSSPVISDISLVAQWNSKVYTVSFDLDGGDGPPPTALSIIHGESANRPSVDPSRTGNALFNDWYLGGNPYDFTSPVISNISLVAGWNFTLRFDLNGGTGRLPVDVLVLENTTVTAPSLNPIKNDDGFDFWASDVGGASPYNFTDPVPDDILLYAQWTGVNSQEVTWQYEEAEDRIRVTGLSNPAATSLSIPASIESVAVEVIANGAFQNESGLQGSLVIPDSVITVEDNAFYDSGFDGTLSLGSSLETIGHSSFRSTTFTGDLIIPDSVLTIDTHAFRHSDFTGDVMIGNNVVSIGVDAFAGVTTVGTLSLGAKVAVIKDGAFTGIDCTGTLIIPASVIEIGIHSFSSTFFNQAYILATQAPIQGTDIFLDTSNLNEIHVRIGATGYGSTWADLPVVYDLP